MFKTKKQLLFLIIGVVLVTILVNVGLGLYLQSKVSEKETASTQVAVVTKAAVKDTFSYKGEEGVDGLTLLKKKSTVSQNASGLVIKIGDRVVSEKKREFWAFYVNGKFSEVGPSEYVTKDTDKIEWKIDTY